MNDDNKNTPLGGARDDSENDGIASGAGAPETGDNGADTDEELDHIAQIFKEEYEKAMDASEIDTSALDIDDEPDEYSPAKDVVSHEYIYDDSPVSDDMLCAYCGEKRRDTSVDPDNAYCTDCRKILQKYPYSVKSILVFAVSLIFVLSAMVYSIGIFSYSVSVAHADKFERSGNVSAALDEYAAIISDESLFESMRVSRKAVELLYKCGQTTYVSTYYDLISENTLKLPMYSYLTDINDKSSAITDTFSACGTLMGDCLDSETGELIYNDAITALNKYENSLDRSTEYYNYYKSAVAYYKYYVAYSCDKDLTTVIGFLSTIQELLPDEMWLYGFALGHAYARTGEPEKAIAISSAMKAYNSGDANSYVIEAAAYRVQKNYEKALEVCEEGLSKYEEDDASSRLRILRQKAIVLLLQGKADEAVATMKDTYEDYLSLDTCDTLAICAVAAGDTELYDDIATIYASQSTPVEFSARVTAYIEGALTVEEIFLEGLADVRL